MCLKHLQDDDEKTRIKALYCLSCICLLTQGAVRGSPPSFAKFTNLNGFASLVQVMQDGNPKLVTRIMFLVTALLNEHANQKDSVDLICELEKVGFYSGVVGYAVQTEMNVEMMEIFLNLIVVTADYNLDLVQSRREDMVTITDLFEAHVKVVAGSEDVSVVNNLLSKVKILIT
jgi:hypothetical protein